ncbi:MAG TPA: hypothetical protein VL651_03975 [Bacteroidia bacterium]|nr:hypothetical protein [Bacteroidia bacterium]
MNSGWTRMAGDYYVKGDSLIYYTCTESIDLSDPAHIRRDTTVEQKKFIIRRNNQGVLVAHCVATRGDPLWNMIMPKLQYRWKQLKSMVCVVN